MRRQNEQGWPADCQEPAKKKESLKIPEAFAWEIRTVALSRREIRKSARIACWRERRTRRGGLVWIASGWRVLLPFFKFY